jgi:hypothetical protein
MPDERMSLADQIRHRLDVGLLPRVLPFKMWSGYGHNDPCNGCGQAIYPAQVKYEFKTHLDSDQMFRLHIGCLCMWLAEQRRRGVVEQTGTE